MAYQLRLWAATLACLLASACATAPPAPPPLPLADLFSNARFAAPSQPVDAGALFELSAPMAAYLNSKKFRSAVRKKGAEMGLVDALYDKQGLQLDYDASSTRDAAETFAARRGNCLSLVLMTAAFAKALKLDVTFQEVRLDPEWSRTGQLYIGSSHVNLNIVSSLLSTSSQPPNALTIDFIAPPQAGRQRTTVISESMIVAMFMNNRAAEELAVGRLDNAYWWARSAVMHEPRFVPAYNTLGVVYQKRGYDELAERVYKRALVQAPENTMIMTNLAPVLASLGKTEESKALAARAASLEPEPPFFFFEKGMKAMEDNKFADARHWFGREVQRAPYNHEFHYWLAIAHLRLGEANAARKEMTLALDHSTSLDASARYSSKLAALRALK